MAKSRAIDSQEPLQTLPKRVASGTQRREYYIKDIFENWQGELKTSGLHGTMKNVSLSSDFKINAFSPYLK